MSTDILPFLPLWDKHLWKVLCKRVTGRQIDLTSLARQQKGFAKTGPIKTASCPRRQTNQTFSQISRNYYHILNCGRPLNGFRVQCKWPPKKCVVTRRRPWWRPKAPGSKSWLRWARSHLRTSTVFSALPCGNELGAFLPLLTNLQEVTYQISGTLRHQKTHVNPVRPCKVNTVRFF